MKYLDFRSEYDKFPKTRIFGYTDQVWSRVSQIADKIQKMTGVIAMETYPGVMISDIESTILSQLQGFDIIHIEKYRKPLKALARLLDPLLTDDRVFGMMNTLMIEDLYDMDAIGEIKRQCMNTGRNTIIIGFGASMIPYDHLIYFDITRWEIQLRFRQGMANFTADNPGEDPLRKFKRGYFVEWRIADRIKKSHLLHSDYIIDAHRVGSYTMITQDAWQHGLNRLSQQPFRLIPYFDPGVWGGDWMQEVCGLEDNKLNYAWAFDGVPEENALCLQFDNALFEFPAINLVFFRPIELLGKRVFERFGTEYPIRFDFLDTMNGGNLSLQVHPLPKYIRDTFGMDYTQDESYYILDAGPDSVVYLGLKEGVKPEALISDLEKANRGQGGFDDDKYINRFPAKKHDHFLIPAGTIHCSGKDTMVLEISSTPYIFTFKLWDWDRLGLDGLPRPVHINHGKEVIQYDRTTPWVQENLINRFEKISEIEEKTGLHELEFIETRRFTFMDKITIQTHESFAQCNLISGRAAIITSENGSFAPFEVHYAETFVIPETIKRFSIAPKYPNDTCMLIQAFVRS
jgi:mannose-6-phosphate isomerase class I